MKSLLLSLIMVLCLVGIAQAEFKVEFPMETNVTGFWFPTDNSVAVGVSHTVIRVSHSNVDKFSLDLDATLAKEINADKDNLAGIGLKVNYNIQKADKTGFVFTPSIGITALNNVKSFATMFQDYRIAAYGTLLLYRW